MYSCVSGYMKLATQCVSDVIVYGVSGGVAGLCVLLTVTIISIVLHKSHMKKR